MRESRDKVCCEEYLEYIGRAEHELTPSKEHYVGPQTYIWGVKSTSGFRCIH